MSSTYFFNLLCAVSILFGPVRALSAELPESVEGAVKQIISKTKEKLAQIPIPPQEKEQIALLAKITGSKLANDVGETHRDAHAKTHGCLNATVTFLPENEVDPLLRKGFFGLPEDLRKEYGLDKPLPARIRLSNGSGEPKANDLAGGGQGMAVKVTLPEKLAKTVPLIDSETWYSQPEDYLTWDFLGINVTEEFFVANPRDYFDFILAKGAADAAKEVALKYVASAQLPKDQANEIVRTVIGAALSELYINPSNGPARPEAGLVLARLSSYFTKNPLQETYNSFAPFDLSDDTVKYKLRPCDTVNPQDYEIPSNIPQSPNLLADVTKHEVSKKDHCYYISAQLHQPNHPEIENVVAHWEFTQRNYSNIAIINIPKSDEILDCESLAFNPAHAPLGHGIKSGINRLRKEVYGTIHTLRNKNKGLVPVATDRNSKLRAMND